MVKKYNFFLALAKDVHKKIGLPNELIHFFNYTETCKLNLKITNSVHPPRKKKNLLRGGGSVC